MLVFLGERPCEQVLLKESTQGLDSRWVNSGKKTTERATMRQTIASEQGHVLSSEGPQTIIEDFQGRLPAQGISNEHGNKVDGIILTEATTCKADLLCNDAKQAEMSEMPCDE